MMTRVDPRLAFKSIHDGQSESDTWPNVLQQIKPQHGGLHYDMLKVLDDMKDFSLWA